MNSRIDRDFSGLSHQCWHLIVVLFVFFGVTLTIEGLATEGSLLSLAGFLCSLLVSPLLLAGVIGRIHAFQNDRTGITRGSFIGNMQHYSWRFLGINLCYLVTVGLTAALLKFPAANPSASGAPGKPNAIVYLCWIPLAALVLFWRIAVVSDDGKVFRSFARTLRALANAPGTLMLGLAWGVLSSADRMIGGYCSKATLLRLATPRAIFFALAGFWVYSRALTLYQEIKSTQWNEVPMVPAEKEVDQSEIGAALRVGWPLAVFSLVPGINLLALIQGVREIRAHREFSLRSVIACAAGGFSVLICLLASLGYLLPRTGTAAERLLASAANRFEMSQVAHAVSYGIIMLLLLASHEYAHAFVAWKLGDDTAKSQGRLTLNPLAHLDIIGSLLLPGLLIWRQSDVVFGWAKPVPVDPAKFANPRRDHRIVSFAGPGINLAVAMASFLLLAAIFFVVRLLAPGALSHKLASPFDAVSLVGVVGGPWLPGVITFLKQLMYTSLALGFFNLLPIPPLDGGWILSSLLSDRARARFEALRPYSVGVFLLLVITHVTDYLLAIPLLMAWGGLSVVCGALGFS